MNSLSGMQGNPHADALKLHQDFGNTLSPTVQATLALAYEQRTQSMILMLNDAVKWANEYPDRVTDEHNRYMQKKREELHARLGMNGATK